MESTHDEKDPTNVVTRVTSDIIKNLQCPVCLTLADPPLMSCINGHFTCSQCLSKLPGESLKKKACPQCRESGFMRNLPYEKIATEFLDGTDIKCPYSDEDTNGCVSTYKYGRLRDHFKECKGLKQKYNCPCPKCTERNLYSLHELIEHITINLGFDTDTQYRLYFLPSSDVGPLDSLIGGILAKLETSSFGRNLGMRLTATETTCSYSTSPIINYELLSEAYTGFNSILIYPPYDFFNNFKKEDELLEHTSAANTDFTQITNMTFLIDTSQITLIRTTCSLTSKMIYCDGTYLNTQYMDDKDPHLAFGVVVNYNYNSSYGKKEEANSLIDQISGEPVNKRSNRNTFYKMKYFDSKYLDFEKYKPEMSEEVINGTVLELGGYTSTHEALGHLKWTLIF
jgi:hypothetical protein